VSIEHARLFIQRVRTDDEFRARILAARDGEARMDLIRSEGFDCTADEIAGAMIALAGDVLQEDAGEAGSRERAPDGPDDWDMYHPN
jgi:predicted ribosomally synthesized peptide with nif11-like leader